MNLVVNAIIALLMTTLLITGCSSSPPPQQDPYNSADSQRSRANQAQDELSSETSEDK